MGERKLRFGIPKGKWLLDHKDRWNIQDVLERAGIGKYASRGIDTVFELNEPYSSEIEPIVLWPNDIARRLYEGGIDIGITTHNLVLEHIKNPLKVQVKQDLHLSYVDLVFATTSEKWAEVQKYTSVDLGKLELFLLSRMGHRVTCLTRYPETARRELRIAEKQLASMISGYKLNLRIKPSAGTVEDQLSGIGAEDIIFETMATGGSIEERGFEVLKNVFNSTAGLYIRSSISDRTGAIERVQRSIQKVIKNLEAMVQVRFVFEITPKTQNLTFNELVSNYEDCEESVYEKICGASSDTLVVPSIRAVDRIVSFAYLPVYANVSDTNIHRIFEKIRPPYIVVHGSKAAAGLIGRDEITEDKMQRLSESLVEAINDEINEKSELEVRLKEIAFYRLKNLYNYCPVFRGSEVMGGGIIRNFSDLKKFYDPVGSYPCADASQLRDEHLDRALIYRYRT